MGPIAGTNLTPENASETAFCLYPGPFLPKTNFLAGLPFPFQNEKTRETLDLQDFHAFLFGGVTQTRTGE